MTKALLEQIEETARLKHEDSAHVIAEALEVGAAKVYADAVLGEYLRGRISRAQAVKRVGRELVWQAERQARAVRADVQWGLNG